MTDPVRAAVIDLATRRSALETSGKLSFITTKSAGQNPVPHISTWAKAPIGLETHLRPLGFFIIAAVMQPFAEICR